MVRPATPQWTGHEMTTRNNPFGSRPGHDGQGRDGLDGNGTARIAALSPAIAGRAPAPQPAADPAATGARVGMDDASVCRLLALLADKTRLKILKLLSDKELHVGALTAELGLPQPTVSHHLAWLRTVGLVAPRRAGKFVFYALGPAAEIGPDGRLDLHAVDATITIRPRKAE